MRYTGPKSRRARRLGMAFTEKDAKVIQRRPTPPGQHGSSRSKVSEFGLQLREKQKLKINYGVLEKQFYSYFQKAQKLPGVTGDNLIKLLEMRLDNVIFRLGFAKTRAQARQLVSHGFFEVDGKRVNIPSFQVKPGSVINVRTSKQQSGYMKTVAGSLLRTKTQDWLDMKGKEMKGVVLSAPTPEQVGNVIDTQMIVEFYSRI